MPEPLARVRQGLWITAIAAPFQVASALIFLRQGVGVPLAEVGVTTRNLGRNALAGLVFAAIFVPGAYGIQALALMALEAAGSTPREHPFAQLGSTGLLPAEWGLLLFGAVVVAPVWEELVYRGLIQPWVMRNGRRGSLAVLGLAALPRRGRRRGGVARRADDACETGRELAPLWILALARRGVLPRRASQTRVGRPVRLGGAVRLDPCERLAESGAARLAGAGPGLAGVAGPQPRRRGRAARGLQRRRLRRAVVRAEGRGRQ